MERIVRSDAGFLNNGAAGQAANELQMIARRGMGELALFLLISTLFFACRGADLLTSLGGDLRVILGAPPPAMLTTIAVVGYTTSAAVLILGRAAAGARPSLKWSHLFFRTVFYPFYIFANALGENFMIPFVAGVFLFALEHLNIWTYSLTIAPRKKEVFGRS